MNGLQQPPLAVGGRRGSHLEIGGRHRHAPPGGAADIPLHNQERLVHVLQRGSVLPYGHRQGGKAHRAAVEFVNHRFQQALVHLVQAVVVWMERAFGPWSMIISSRKSSMAGYRYSSMAGCRRWISSINRISPFSRLVSTPARSPAFSIWGPEVV